MKPVRIAVLGMHHGYKFASHLMTMPGIELVAVAGNDDLSVKRAQELGVPIFQDYRELVGTCPLDGVIIALPNHLHKPAVELCASKGLHILLEKPIATTIEEGQAIIDACAKYGVRLLVGHHRRFSSKLVKLREIIASGKLGELVGATMLWATAKNREYFEAEWRLHKETGGPFLNNAVHDIDDFRFVTGQQVSQVYAVACNNIRKHPVEDAAVFVMKTKEGAVVNYFISDGVPAPWSYELTVHENKDYFPCLNENCYYFFGTKGSIAFPTLKIYSYLDGKWGWFEKLQQENVMSAENDPLWEELRHFLDVATGKAEPLITGQDALETLRILNAIKESAEKDKVIYLD